MLNRNGEATYVNNSFKGGMRIAYGSLVLQVRRPFGDLAATLILPRYAVLLPDLIVR